MTTRNERQRTSTVCLIGFVFVMLGMTVATGGWRTLSRDAVRGVPTEYRIDVNSADAPTLRLLPGIGPQLGQKIVKQRAKGVSWGAVEELQDISGIGPGKIAKIKPWSVCVPPQTQTPRDSAQAGSPW